MKISSLFLIIAFITRGGVFASACAQGDSGRPQAGARLFAPGEISVKAPYTNSPAFSSRWGSVYLTQSNGAGSSVIMRSLQDKDGKWSELLPASFSGTFRDLEPAFSPDGSYLIFASNRPAAAGDSVLNGHYNGSTQSGNGGNLWKAGISQGGAGVPMRLPEAINANSSVFSPAVTGDGSLYFMRADSGAKFHIYRSQLKDGLYQAPVKALFSMDSFGDYDPVVAPDESFLIFSSGRPPAQKSSDLFIVFRTAGGWSEPIDLRGALGDEVHGIEARLSPDLKLLYYSNSNNATGAPVAGEQYIWKVDLSALLHAHGIDLAERKSDGERKIGLGMPAVFARGVISTGLDDGAISFAPDGQTVFTSQGGFTTIIYSRKKKGIWQRPQVAPFSGKWNDTDPFFSPDGKKLFFISNRPLPGSDQPQKVLQIWYTVGPDQWSDPQRLDSSVNRDGVGSFAPSVSKKGTLYFCSRRKENPGMQSYRAIWLGDHYSMAELISVPGVNQIQDPFIAPDESYMVFLSGKDLYVTFPQSSGWSTAQMLGSNVNNGDQNFSPYVSPDGKTLYYTSSRTRGFYQRQQLHSYEELEKENAGVFNASGNILMVAFNLQVSGTL